jgi:FKBP-type peptidyl-prolyl cis-trans isomerase
MKTALNLFLIISLGAVVLGAGCAQPGSAAKSSASPAETKPAPSTAGKSAAKPADQSNTLTNLADKVAYAIGMNIGETLKRQNFDVSLDEIMVGMKDSVSGNELKLNPRDARTAILEYQRQRQQEMAAKNEKLGEAFMATNHANEGVRVLWVAMPDGKAVQMQYKVITEGTGESPKSNDVVTVNYRGTLLNGKEFDSSARFGQAAKLPMTSIIRGRSPMRDGRWRG